jgi:hypothetical protein
VLAVHVTLQRELIVGGAALGVVGAWLSVLQRTGSADLDIGAGTFLFAMEGWVRLAIGGVGGFFVALLLVAGWVLPLAKTNHALFAAVCLVAGLSERLVNSLATDLAGKAALKDRSEDPAKPGRDGTPGRDDIPQVPVPHGPPGGGASPARPAAEGVGVATVTPAEAQPGSVIAIEGRGFGADAGTVTFGTAESPQIRTWTTTRITVVLPELGAGLVDVMVRLKDAQTQVIAKAALRVLDAR